MVDRGFVTGGTSFQLICFEYICEYPNKLDMKTLTLQIPDSVDEKTFKMQLAAKQKPILQILKKIVNWINP